MHVKDRPLEGNEGWKMLASRGVVAPSAPTAIPPLLCLRPLTRVARLPPPLLPSPRSDNGMCFSKDLEVAPTPVAPAKRAPRTAPRHLITLHQIKSNKLITNNCRHASNKYWISIIDLILSVLSEKCQTENYSVDEIEDQVKLKQGCHRTIGFGITYFNTNLFWFFVHQKFFPPSFTAAAECGYGGGRKGCFMHATICILRAHKH